VWQYIKFWLVCFNIGWGVGGAVVGFIRLLAGIVSAIFLFRKLAQHKKDLDDLVLKISLLVFAAIVIFTTYFVAPYLKFSSADTARMVAEANGPKLDGFINQQIVGEGVDSNSLVILQVSVNNSGNRASIAEFYRLYITLTNHTTVEGELVDIPDEYTTVAWKSNSPVALTLKRSELIAEKPARRFSREKDQGGGLRSNSIIFYLINIILRSARWFYLS